MDNHSQTSSGNKSGSGRRKGKPNKMKAYNADDSRGSSKEKASPEPTKPVNNDDPCASPTDSVESALDSELSQSSVQSGDTAACSEDSNVEVNPKLFGKLPEYQYTKDELMKLKDKSESLMRPEFLASEFDTLEGKWDPDRWSQADGGKDTYERSGSFNNGRDKKRPSDIRDPKQRLREEADDITGIVLSPQRRSFLSGCHVPQGNTNSLSSSKDGDRRDPSRRTGSGRINLDRSNSSGPSSDWGNNNDDKPPPRDLRGIVGNRERDFRDPGKERDPRDFRDYDDGGGRRYNDRYSLNRNRDAPRDMRTNKEPRDLRAIAREFGNRDRGQSKYGGSGRGYNRYHKEEAEPEWLNEDIEQGDTMELRGFDQHEDKKKKAKAEKADKQTGKSEMPKSLEKIMEKRKGGAASRKEAAETEVKQTDGKEDGNKATGTVKESSNGEFDFNEFFSAASIPGLPDIPLEQNGIAAPTGVEKTGSGSRFSQWFNSKSEESANNLLPMDSKQRRPSIGEDFSFLNSLLDHQSPVFDGRPNGSHSPDPSVQNQLMALVAMQQQNQQQPQPPLTSAGFINLLNRNTSPLGSMGPNQNQVTSAMASLRQNQGARGGMAASMSNPDLLRQMTNASLPTQSQQMDKNQLLSALSSGAQASRLAAAGGIPRQHLDMLQQQLFQQRHSPSPPHRLDHLPQPAISMPVPLPGKMMSVSELEAGLSGGNDSKHHQDPASGAAPASLMDNMQQNPPQPLSVQLQQQRNLQAALQRQQQTNAQTQQASAPSSRTEAAHGIPPDSLSVSGSTGASSAAANSDMSAFNKLVGMLTVNGNLSDAPSMTALSAQAKAQHQPRFKPQHQQVQQPQPQSHMKQEPKPMNDNLILNFMKQNPQILKNGAPAEPTSARPAPKMTLQAPVVAGPTGSIRGPVSPRPAPSPVASAQSTLMPPPPASPRAASPIMFGSQPPMHLTAPSPIHANAPNSPTSATSNTLQVGQQVNRVPSPAELRFHTQRIMQNALIKKQLEEQKERFLKKQQDRGKSPNVFLGPFSDGMNLENTVSSPPHQAVLQKPPPQLQAFTPTSVIRKMATDKADKQGFKADEGKPSDMGSVADQLAMLSGGGVSTGHNVDTYVQAQQAHPRALFGKGVMHGGGNSNTSGGPPGTGMPGTQHYTGSSSTMAGSLFTNNPSSATGRMSHTGPTGAGAQGRPIIKVGQQKTVASGSGSGPCSPSKVLNPPSGITANGSHLDMNALLANQAKMQQNNPGFTRLPNSNQFSTAPPLMGAGRGSNSQNQALAAQLHMQRLMQSRGLPMSSYAAMQQTASTVQQQRALHGTGHPAAMYQSGQSTFNPANQSSINSGLLAINHDLHNDASQFALSRQSEPHAGQQQESGRDNLAKWFSPDVLQQGLSNLPPLPNTQGKVMSLDEIEQCQQQTVSH